jgi:hypothetical protein
MGNKQTSRTKPAFVVRPALLGAAALLGAGISGAVWLSRVQGRGPAALLAGVAFAVTAAVGIVWQLRATAARRRLAVLELYAQREIARARGR